MIRCIPHLSAASFFGSLTCQPSLPDVPPQQIPSFGRGLPQLLADRAPQLKLAGRLPLGGHCGAAGLIFTGMGVLRCVKAHAGRQAGRDGARARAAAIVVTPLLPSPGQTCSSSGSSCAASPVAGAPIRPGCGATV